MNKYKLIEAMIPWIFSKPDYVRRGRGGGKNKYLIAGLSGSGKTTHIKKLPKRVHKVSADYFFRGSKDIGIDNSGFKPVLRRGLQSKKPFAAEGVQLAYLMNSPEAKRANLRVKRTSFLKSTYRAWNRDRKNGGNGPGIVRRVRDNLNFRRQLNKIH